MREQGLDLEAICLEMGYVCSARTVRNVMASMEYTLPWLYRTPLYQIPGYTGCSGSGRFPTTKFSLAIPDVLGYSQKSGDPSLLEVGLGGQEVSASKY